MTTLSHCRPIVAALHWAGKGGGVTDFQREGKRKANFERSLMVAFTRQLEAKIGRAAMSRSRLCSGSRQSPAAYLAENSRRGNFFLDACMWHVEDHLSRGRLLCSDGASLKRSVDAFVDPIGILAGDPNFYRYVGNGPTMYVDPSGLEMLPPDWKPPPSPPSPRPRPIQTYEPLPMCVGLLRTNIGDVALQNNGKAVAETGTEGRIVDGQFIPDDPKVTFPVEPSTGSLAFDAVTTWYGGPLLKGATKALGATARVIAETPLIGRGLTSGGAKAAAEAATKVVSTGAKAKPWSALSTTQKVYYEVGQILTTGKTHSILAVFGEDVASTVAKGKYLLQGKGKWGLACDFAKGSVELGWNTVMNASTGRKTAFDFGRWIATEATPAMQWLVTRLPAVPGAIGSYWSRIDSGKPKR